MVQHKKHSVLLHAIFWLLVFCIPIYSHAQNEAVYQKANYTVKQKKEADINYYLLSHGKLSIHFGINDTNSAIRFFFEGSKPSRFFFTSVESVDDIILFPSEKQDGYYVVLEQYVEEWQAFEIYFISADKVSFEGAFSPDERHADAFYLAAAQTSATPEIILRKKEKDLELSVINNNSTLNFTKTSFTGEYYNIVGLIEKLEKFNWKSDFIPKLKYTLKLDLDNNEEFETYGIDWKNHKISYLDKNALALSNDKYIVDPITFRGDTLAVKKSTYVHWVGTDDSIERTFYFTLSKEFNTALLSAYRYQRYYHIESTQYCRVDEVYSAQPGTEVLLEEFDPIQVDRHNYYRSFTLNSLLSYLQNEAYFTECTSPPAIQEIYELLFKEELNAKTVLKYNDIAYYFAELSAKDKENKPSLIDSSILLLEKITKAFPDRTVAYLNLADAYWEKDPAFRPIAKTHYAQYVDLMKKQGKDMAKIPNRVYNRINNND